MYSNPSASDPDPRHCYHTWLGAIFLHTAPVDQLANCSALPRLPVSGEPEVLGRVEQRAQT